MPQSRVGQQPPVALQPIGGQPPDCAEVGRAAENVGVEDEHRLPRDWRAYTSLLSGFLLMFNSWGIVNAYGTFMFIYERNLLVGTSIMNLNLIGSTQCFIALAASLFVGRLCDANYSRYLIVAGTLLTSAGLLSLSYVDGKSYVLTWLVQGLLQGFGFACFFVTSSQVVGTWFVKTKGFAVGVVATGASIAGLVYPIMLRNIYEQKSFRHAVQYMTLMCFLTSVLAGILSKPNPRFTYRKIPKWTAFKTWADLEVFSSPPWVLFTCAIAMMFFGFYGIFFNLQGWASQEGIGFDGEHHPMCMENPSACQYNGLKLKTYWLLAIMNGTSSVGRLSSSFLCDRFGALNVHAFVSLLSAALCLFMWVHLKTLEGGIAFVCIFGAFSGSVIGLPPASMAAILGPEQKKLGQWLGQTFFIAAPFALTGPVIEGYLVSRYKINYLTIQIFSGLCLLSSAMFMISAKWMADRTHWIKDRQVSVDSSASA